MAGGAASLIGGLSPELAWGLFTRLLGIIYLIAIGSLWHQVVPIAGAKGITPVGQLLGRMRRDYPRHIRLLYYPSLLWLSSRDWVLRAYVVLGCAAALWAIVGGPHTWAALLACWAVFLSFDVALELIYPWDCVLLEAGFLALFLPGLELLPALGAVAPPAPIVALAFNLLLIRILVGFGKHKFVGSTRHDRGYLREFLINQPWPTRLGWYAHHLPAWVHRVGLFGLAVVELALPPLALLGGPIRLVPAVATAGLMLAIQLTGNYGFFNLIVLALCVPLLDFRSPLAELSLGAALASPGSAALHLAVLVNIVGGLLYFPFNSWCTRCWLNWPALDRLPSAPLRGLLALYRLLLNWRVVHAYGVFPPQTGPALKFVPVIEGSHDGAEWREYGYQFFPSHERSAPTIAAPYHPRLDHYLLYEGHGLNQSGFWTSTVGPFNPYNYSHHSLFVRAMQRLTEPDSPVRRLFGRDPFAGGPPPRFMRARVFALEPTSPAERARTGQWWRRYVIGTHVPAFESNPAMLDDWLPSPETFHWDARFWRRRSPALRALARGAAAAASVDELEAAVTSALCLPPAAIAAFWDDLLPAVTPDGAGAWSRLGDTVAAARARWGVAGMRELERVAGALAVALAAAVDARGETELHTGMLANHLLLLGRAGVDRALRDPVLVRAEQAGMGPATGLWLWGVFRFETLAFHARATRLTRSFHVFPWEPGVPGFALVQGFVADQLGDEGQVGRLELSRRIADGHWQVRFADPGA
jgi:hypothetical protein